MGVLYLPISSTSHTTPFLLNNAVIPLAKKLKECGVFGVSSDEYLGYAISNRDRWEQHGEEVVEELKGSAKEIDKEFEMQNISASTGSNN